MDELKLLRDWDAGTEPPRQAVRRAARDRLLETAGAAKPGAAPVRAPTRTPLRPGAQPPLVVVRGPGAGGPSRRTVVRTLVAAGATAAAVAAPVALLERGGTAGPAAPGDATPAGMLRRAARLEREQERLRPPIEPRRGQYVYAREFVRETPGDGGGAATYTPETWLAADPSHRSWTNRRYGGDGWLRSEPGLWPPADWRGLTRIPAEPTALLTHISSFGAGKTPDEFDRADWRKVYTYVGRLLERIPVLPDGLLPALLEALAECPRPELLPGATDAKGREALGIVFPDHTGWSRYLLFATDTHEYLGMQHPRGRDVRIREFTRTSHLDTYAVVDEVRKRP